MADNISIRGGNKKGMPTLRDRELAFVRDEEALYIGSLDGNLKLCSADTEEKIAENLTQFEEELEGLRELVLGLGQGGSGSSGFITSIHDGNGNVAIGGVSVSHDGNGNVVFR